MTSNRVPPAPRSLDQKASEETALFGGKTTLKLGSYQRPERRSVAERRSEPVRAVMGERRTTTQRVLRALFGT